MLKPPSSIKPPIIACSLWALLLFALGFILGTLRVLVTAPALGVRAHAGAASGSNADPGGAGRACCAAGHGDLSTGAGQACTLNQVLPCNTNLQHRRPRASRAATFRRGHAPVGPQL
jgi:hypothetical protein